MAIGTRTYGNGGGDSAAATFTVSYPASIAAGDLLILACYTRSNNASAFSQPTDWSTVKACTATANGSYAVYYKVAVGTESGSFTVTGSTSNNTEVAKMVRIPGASTSFTQGAAETEAAGLTFTNSGVTPAVDNSLVVLVTGFQDHSTSTGDTGFSGWTGGTNLGTWDGSAYGTTTGTDGTIGIGTALQTTAAATGNISVTHTDETNDAGISYSFAVAPSSTFTNTASDTAWASDGTPGRNTYVAMTLATDTAGAVEITQAKDSYDGTPSITYPSASQSVTSPVTFTGKAMPSSTVELWDTNVFIESDTASASDTQDFDWEEAVSDTFNRDTSDTGWATEIVEAYAAALQRTLETDTASAVEITQVYGVRIGGDTGEITDDEWVDPTDVEAYKAGIEKTVPADTARATEDTANKADLQKTLVTDTANATEDGANRADIRKTLETDTAWASESQDYTFTNEAVYTADQSDTAWASEDGANRTELSKPLVTDTAFASELEANKVDVTRPLATDTAWASENTANRSDLAKTLVTDTAFASESTDKVTTASLDESDTAWASESQDYAFSSAASYSRSQSSEALALDSGSNRADLQKTLADSTGASDLEGFTYSGAPAVENAIIYPANLETVMSPVTFTGTATPSSTVELWDSPATATLQALDSARASESTGFTFDVSPSITHPTDAESVASPVTFTGTATPASTVELWDTTATEVLETLQASEQVAASFDVAPSITYPTEDESVPSPVTFTGTATPASTVELWDSPVSDNIIDTARASEALGYYLDQSKPAQAYKLAAAYEEYDGAAAATPESDLKGLGREVIDVAVASDAIYAGGSTFNFSREQVDSARASDSIAYALYAAIGATDVAAGTDTVLSKAAFALALADAAAASSSLDAIPSSGRPTVSTAIAAEILAFALAGDTTGHAQVDVAAASDFQRCAIYPVLGQRLWLWNGSAWV